MGIFKTGITSASCFVALNQKRRAGVQLVWWKACSIPSVLQTKHVGAHCNPSTQEVGKEDRKFRVILRCIVKNPYITNVVS